MERGCIYRACVVVSIIVIHVYEGTGNTTTATEGESKLIQWTIDPPIADVAIRIISPSDETLFTSLGTTILLGAGSNAERVSNTGNTNTNTGHIEFTLNDVRVTDAGDYKAHYDRGTGGIFKTGVMLVIYVKPSKPFITVITSSELGQDMVLQCTAASNSKPDGQLTMKYKWYINNADLPTESRYVTVESQLQVKNIQKSDKDSTFTCKGYESITLLSEASDGHTLNIKYKPGVVTLSPNTEQYTNEENDNIGTITCSADCNPSCTYQWSFNSANIGGQSSTLTLNNIQRGSAGSYRCTATNKHGSSISKTITIAVKYGPKTVTLSPNSASYILVEVTQNSLGQITCSTDCNPLCTYQWSRDGSVIRSAAVLELTGATRAYDGIYICNASNSYGIKASEKVRITVEYKPETLKIEPSLFSYVLLESDKLGPINCSANCNPPCEYKWRRNNVNTIQTAVLDITKVNRREAGTYTCVATNKHGHITSNGVSVVVEYPPDKVIIQKDIGTEDIEEGNIFSIICTTDCVPSRSISVWLEGERQSIVYEKSSSLQVNYTKSAVCMDSGRYFCIAKNYRGSSTSRKLGLSVLCSPRPKTGISVNNSVTVGDKEDLNITGTVVANPRPDILWTFRRDGNYDSIPIGNKTDDVEIYMASDHVTYSSQIVKKNINAGDFGLYAMNASNIYGWTLLFYNVFWKRVPDPPYNLSVACDYTEATIRWISNFNGGVTQKFITKVSETSHVHGIYTTPDKGMNQQHEQIVTGLDSDTKYTFVVRADNLIGISTKSSTFECTTKNLGLACPLQDQSTFKAGIAMIVIGALCFGASLVLTFYSFRRMHMQEQLNTTSQTSRDHPQTSFERENDAYTELDMSRPNLYEDLGEKEKPSLYDRLKVKRKTDEAEYVNTKIN